MLNNDKVKIMTKLAIYDKNKGKKDKRVMEYFKTDYVSFNNFKLQLGVTIALVLIFMAQFSIIVLENISTITEFDFISLGKKYLIIWVIVMLIYTLISTFINRKEYNKAKKRIDEYKNLLEDLDKFQ